MTLDKVRTVPSGSNPLKGGKLRLTIQPDGRVVDVSGTGGLFSLAGVDPRGLFGRPGAGAESAGSQVLFPWFPDHKISPGDRWSRSTSIPLPFGHQKVTVGTDGRFSGYDTTDRRAANLFITITTPLDYKVPIAELTKAASAGRTLPSPSPVPGNVVLSGRSVTSSRVTVVPSTGELLRMSGRTTISVRMNVEGVPGAAAGGSVPAYAFDSTITMSIARAARGQPSSSPTPSSTASGR
jgi:hypothetical protein